MVRTLSARVPRVRRVPRLPRRPRVAVGLVVVAMTAGVSLGSLVAPGAFADRLHDKQRQVQRKIHKAGANLDDSSTRLQQAAAALARAQGDLLQARGNLSRTRGQLAAAQAFDRQMQQRLDDAIARLDKARADLVSGRAQVAEQERQLRRMVAATYEQGDPALMGLSMLLTTQDPAQLTANLNANTTVMDKQSAVLSRLRAAKVLLRVRQDDTRKAKQDVVEKRRAAAENLKQMQALELQAEQAAQQVEQMVTLREQARAEALQAKSADLAELRQLRTESDRIQQLIREKAPSTRFTGAVDGGGTLSAPVNGPVTSPFGWRIHPIWGYRSLHDGVDLGVGCGTPVKAPASGVVLSTYYSSVLGNRIVMNNGVLRGLRVVTAYNHLERYIVSPGQRVTRGQTIGYAGTTGWSTGCHLHFTVIQNGTVVDPFSWL